MMQHGTHLPQETLSPENNVSNHTSRMSHDWVTPEALPVILSSKSDSREKEVLDSYSLFTWASTI